MQGLKILKDALQKISLPSAFILQTVEGTPVVGTVKESGVKEIPSEAFTLSGNQLFGAG